MPGRPKPGLPPTCALTGPCLARRVRRSSQQHGGAGKDDTQCHNCAKPLHPTSFQAYIDNHPFTVPDFLQHAYQDISPEPHGFTANQWFVLQAYSFVFPDVNVNDKQLRSFQNCSKAQTREWLLNTFNLGSVSDTFHGSHSLHDFAYCQRHTKTPTKLFLQRLLDRKQYKQITQAIERYEARYNTRLVGARRFYNDFARKYNAHV